jgi:hypothetical protein
MRRVKATIRPDQPERRYLHVDVSQRGQLRYYVQLRNKLPKVRITAELGTAKFDAEVDAAVAAQIALYGNQGDYINAQKATQRGAPCPAGNAGATRQLALVLERLQAKRSLARRSQCRPGGPCGFDAAPAYRIDREPVAGEWREAVRGADTQGHQGRNEVAHALPGGELLSALRGMIRWMVDEGHLDEDDDPTIGLRSGKAKASRESGGFLPWTEGDMALYRAKWPLGTEARLMFDILHYTFLRLGDAHRFGPPHLRQVVRKMAVQIATEKSRGQYHRDGSTASRDRGKP